MKAKRYWITAPVVSVAFLASGIWVAMAWANKTIGTSKPLIDYSVANTPEELFELVEDISKSEEQGLIFSKAALEGLTKFGITYKLICGVILKQKDCNDPILHNRIQSAIELKLRLAGIQVISAAEWKKTPTRPYLSVIVRIYYRDEEQLIKHRKRFGEPPEYMTKHRVVVTVTLVDQISLVRKPDLIYYTGVWANQETKDDISHTFPASSGCYYVAEQLVKDIMDRFVSDYLASNPPKD